MATPMKWLNVLAVVCGILLLVLVGGLLAVRYFFPAEVVRQQLEEVLSRQLEANVLVASLEWDLLSRIRLGPVEIERNGARFAKFDDLALRYNLWHLLHGELVIEELVLKRAGVFLALQALAAAPDAEPPPEPPTPPTLPSLPLAIDLQSVQLLDSEVAVTRDDGLRLALHHVNLTAELSAGPRRADVSGTLDVADVEVELANYQRQAPLHIEFTVVANLSDEQVVVERLHVRSDPVIRLTMTGRVDHVVSSRDLTLSVDEGHVDLEQLLPLLMPFLPPHLAGMRVAGTIEPKVTVKGGLATEGFNGTVDLDLRGTAVSGSIPSLKVALEPAAFHLRTGEISVRANLPRAIRADLSFTSTGATVQTISLRNLDLQMGAHHAESGEFSTRMGLTGNLSTPPFSRIQPLSEPMEMVVEASGNMADGSVSLSKLAAHVGKLLSVEASGAVSAKEGTTAERTFAVKALVATDLPSIFSAVPPAAVRGIALTSRSTLQKFTLNVTGKLDSEFRPRQADAIGELELSGLRASSTEMGVGGTLDWCRVEMQTTFRAQTQTLKGTVTAVVALADLKQGTSIALEQAQLKLRSELSGTLSPEMVVRQLKTVNHLDVEARRLRYAGTGVSGRLEQLTVSASTDADVLEGTYVLDSLRLTAGALLDMRGKAEFRSKSRQFSIDVSVPSFNVAELKNHLSGTDVLVMSEVNPKGRVAMQIRASGALPRPEQLTALEIPVTFFMNLELHDVAGAFRDHAVTGANGNVRISASPKDRQRLTCSWNVRARRLDIGEALPIKQLDGFSADAEMSAEDLDNVTLDRLRIGAEGVKMTLEGELSGAKRILVRKEGSPLTSLGPLFIKIRSTLDLDLDRFAEVVRSYGITGSGHAGISVNLFKKERGPLDVRLRVLPRGLSLTKDATRVEDVEGLIAARKVLQWMPGLDGASPDAAFTPTEILPELLASTPSRRDLRIRRLETQGIQVRDLSAILAFDQNRLVVQDLAMTVLDGGLGGEVVLTGGKSFGLTMRLEAARLDMNRLLPPENQVRGDSLVDGTVNLTARFEPDHGRLDFGRSKLDLHLTRIGRETLNQVLRFLDPKGSNPSIVGARSAAQLANPSAVRVTLFKGLVGLQIKFQEGLLARFEMDRIPVSQIKQVQDITRTIPQWAAIRRAMELLGADRYGVDQAGTFVLQ